MDLIAKYFDELSPTEVYEILKARAEIFIVEQKILYQDMDDIDYKSLHCFFVEKGKAIAYLRAFPLDRNGDIVRIGRVLTLQHGNGTGKELLEKSLAAIVSRMNPKKIEVHAQKYVEGFYEKFGFKAISEDFLEAGIVHVAMELEL
ncbi:MAG: GNAT family N-acetyltransferase [Acutalibacteraceae bacterium]